MANIKKLVVVILFLKTYLLLGMDIIGKKEEIQSSYRRMVILMGPDNVTPAIDRKTKEPTTKSVHVKSMSEDLLLFFIEEASPILIELRLFNEFLGLLEYTFHHTQVEKMKEQAEKKQELLKSGKIPSEPDDPLSLINQLQLNKWHILYCPDTRFYLLIPRSYVQKILGYETLQFTQEEENILGLKIQSCKNFDITLARNDPQRTFEEINNRRNELVKVNNNFLDSARHYKISRLQSLQKIFVLNPSKQTAPYRWNFYMTGHGNQKIIAALSITEFQEILTFFNTHIPTNFLYYVTCFGGGKNLIEPYKPFTGPHALNYIVASGATTDAAVSTRWMQGGYTQDWLVGYRKEKHKRLPVVLYNNAFIYKPLVDLNQFFTTLEANESIEKALSFISNLHGLTMNIPLVRFPGTEWFSAVDINKKIAVINRVRTLTHAADNKPFDIKDKAAVLVYQPAIPVPIILHNQEEPIDTLYMAPDSFHYLANVSIENLRNFQRGLTQETTIWSRSTYLAIDELTILQPISIGLATLHENYVQELFRNNIIEMRIDKIIMRNIRVILFAGPTMMSTNILEPAIYIKDNNDIYYRVLLYQDFKTISLEYGAPGTSWAPPLALKSLEPRFEELRRQAQLLKKEAEVVGKIPQLI